MFYKLMYVHNKIYNLQWKNIAVGSIIPFILNYTCVIKAGVEIKQWMFSNISVICIAAREIPNNFFNGSRICFWDRKIINTVNVGKCWFFPSQIYKCKCLFSTNVKVEISHVTVSLWNKVFVSLSWLDIIILSTIFNCGLTMTESLMMRGLLLFCLSARLSVEIILTIGLILFVNEAGWIWSGWTSGFGKMIGFFGGFAFAKRPFFTEIGLVEGITGNEVFTASCGANETTSGLTLITLGPIKTLLPKTNEIKHENQVLIQEIKLQQIVLPCWFILSNHAFLLHSCNKLSINLH